MLTPVQIKSFHTFIFSFFERFGRHDLPWRQDYDGYKVLVSEVMLQQTQVERVIPKFTSFLNTFPSFESLAKASPSEVLRHWVGLGYNRRALNLHRAAEQVILNHAGMLPADEKSLQELAGVGPYTSAALQAFVFNLPSLVIETNIRTVFIYHFFPNQTNVSDQEILSLIKVTLPEDKPREWFSALMDYGAYLKKVLPNPSRHSQTYSKQSIFKGSLRQARGAILKKLVEKHSVSRRELLASLKLDPKKIAQALKDLHQEGFLTLKDETVSLN